MNGQKIIDGLRDALEGDLHRVTIDGQVWVRATDLASDQQEIMRINNELREVLKSLLSVIDRVAWRDSANLRLSDAVPQVEKARAAIAASKTAA